MFEGELSIDQSSDFILVWTVCIVIVLISFSKSDESLKQTAIHIKTNSTIEMQLGVSFSLRYFLFIINCLVFSNNNQTSQEWSLSGLLSKSVKDFNSMQDPSCHLRTTTDNIFNINCFFKKKKKKKIGLIFHVKCLSTDYSHKICTGLNNPLFHSL